ncbi:MAG: sensor histidine kinase [Lachnospiraceae bacterium]|jgi:two-component system sensor histidine kinase DegS|nr:sensor histidine kinase [Lachnospiraceae bacterium]
MENSIDAKLTAMVESFLDERKELKRRASNNTARVDELEFHLQKQEEDDEADLILSPHRIGKEQMKSLMKVERSHEKDFLEAENKAIMVTLDMLDERIKTINEVISVEPFLNRFRFLDMQEEERQRIARDLHDSSLQNLTHLIHTVELCSLYMDSDKKRAKLELLSIAQKLREVIEEMRSTIYDLRPMEFDDLGFCEAIQTMVSKMQMTTRILIRLDMPDSIKVKNDLIYSNIYRIVRECVSNAVKHSNANEVVVKLRDDINRFYVEISDEGIGFDKEHAVHFDVNHFGLKIISERVRLLKGSLEIVSRSEGKIGTVVKIEIPTNTRNLQGSRSGDE